MEGRRWKFRQVRGRQAKGHQQPRLNAGDARAAEAVRRLQRGQRWIGYRDRSRAPLQLPEELSGNFSYNQLRPSCFWLFANFDWCPWIGLMALGRLDKVWNIAFVWQSGSLVFLLLLVVGTWHQVMEFGFFRLLSAKGSVFFFNYFFCIFLLVNKPIIQWDYFLCATVLMVDYFLCALVLMVLFLLDSYYFNARGWVLVFGAIALICFCWCGKLTDLISWTNLSTKQKNQVGD